MEDKNKEIDNQEAVAKIGSGAMLAAARKEQNRSVEDIADKLNLSQTQIRTIELDQSEGLPEPTYVRGYIRSYANLLGLDPELVLEHYLNKNWQKSAKLDDMPRGIGEAESNDTSLFSPARVIVFALIVGALSFFWWSGGLDNVTGGDANRLTSDQDDQVGDVAAPLSQPSAIAPSETESSQISNVLDDATNDLESNVGTTALAEDELSSEQGSTQMDIADAAELGSSETRLVLSFTETSWVDIRDEQQNRLAYQSYPADETLSVSAVGMLSVLIGNAKGVTMTVNGVPYDLSQHTEGVYAKFSVGNPQ